MKLAITAALAVVAALLGGTASAQAASCNYTGSTGGSWQTAGNWSCGSVPGSADDVTLSGGDNVALDTASATVQSLMLDSGTLQLRSSWTLTVTGATTVRSGTVSGPGQLTASGALTKTTGGRFFLNGAATLELGANSTWDGGDICQGESLLRVRAELRIASGSLGVICAGSTSRIDVDAPNGRLLVDAASTIPLPSTLDNDDTVDVDSGTLRLTGTSGDGDSGAFNVAAGAELRLESAISLASGGRIGGPGLVRVTGNTTTIPDGASFDPAQLVLDGGSMTVNGSSPAVALPSVRLTGGTLEGTRNRSIGTLSVDSGTIAGSQTATVTGSMSKTTTGRFFLNGGATLDLAANSTWSGGDICQGESLLRLRAELLVDSGAQGVICAGSTSRIDVDAPNGRLLVDAGSTIPLPSRLDNDDTVDVASGTLRLNGPSGDGHSGAFNVSAGAELRLENEVTLASGGRIGGPGVVLVTGNTTTVPNGAQLDPAQLVLDGGTLTVNGTAPAVTLPSVRLSGGTLDGTRNRSIAALNIESGTVSGNHTSTVTGSLTKTTTGRLFLNGGATLDVQPDWTWADGDICQGDSVLRNRGTLTIANEADGVICGGAGSEIQIAAPTGRLVRAGAGTTGLAARVVNAGTIPLGTGHVLNFNGGLVLQAGGVLSGTGTAGGSVNNQAGVVRPGASPGRLTVGSYTQGTNGTLEVEIDGTTPITEFDVLTVTGAASLGGTLAIDQGFNPSSADTFQVVTSASRTGTFANLTGDALSGGRRYTADYPGTPSFGARLVVSAAGSPVAGTPRIAGLAELGSTVTCQPGSWTNSPAFTFEWLRDGSPIATGDQYTVVQADLLHQLACRVTGTNPSGSATATSASVTVAGIGPTNVTPPAIVGTPAVGGPLTCDPGTWSGVPAPAITFEWTRDGVVIPGQTGPTYTPTRADEGHVLGCVVSARNQFGSAGFGTATVTVPVPQATQPTPQPPLSNATPQQVASAFGLPPAKSCISKRHFPIRLREPNGIKIKKAKVLVNGKAVDVKKAKGRFTADVDLRGLPKGKFTVAIKITTKDGRTLKGARTYRTCSKKRRGGRPPIV
jgi:hypothetical protein